MAGVDFRRGVVTPESVWRALILYGANSATYKFAFSTALLEFAAGGSSTRVRMDELAPRYAELLCEALKRQQRQATAGTSRFLEACRSFNTGDIDLTTLHEHTERLGFANVVTAFPRLGGSDAPIEYFKDRRTDRQVKGLVLTDELFRLANSVHAANVVDETTARWRLVETAWSLGLSRGLVGEVIAYDPETECLTVEGKLRRRSVTGAVAALSGYQDGRCAYCEQLMATRGLGQTVVEHVLPWVLLTRRWSGPDLDAVWNLVLSCQPCNSAKLGRAPHESWMPWLEGRNEDLIASNHPLRETLMTQTGNTPDHRHAMLRAAYATVTEMLPAVWTPPRTPKPD